MLRPLLCLSILGACGNAASESAPEKTDDKPVKLAGVYPKDWKCESVTTPAQIGEVVGGTAELNPSPSSIPNGLPQPCSYQVTTASGPEYWTWDADCRPTYKKTADALFEQYTKTSADLVQAYKEAQDAPKPPPPKHKAGEPPADAAPPERPPEVAVPVDVGSKGLDHHGQGLIFIDDDAPCYVRVVGGDAPRRFELAKLVAKNLTFANAPMTPRPFP